MAPVKTNHDYYAILEVEQTADPNSIRASYRRLAKIKHPDKNPTDPNATSEFQLIQEAYSTLFDVEARRAYDLRYPPIKRSAGQTESVPKTCPKEDPTAGPTAGPTTAPKTAPKRRPASYGATSQNKARERQKTTLQQLRAKRSLQTDDLLEVKRVLRGLQAEVAQLNEEIDRAAIEIAAMGKKRTHRTQLSTAKMQEIEEQKDKAQRKRFNRIVVLRLKHSMLEQQEEKCRRCEASLQLTESEIIKLKNEIRRERAEEEKAKRKSEQEYFRPGYDLDEKWREREAEEAREVEELWRRREEAEEEENRRHEEEMEEARRRRKREERANPKKTERPRQHGCLYGGEWDRIEQPMICGRCLIGTHRFAFGCPYCGRIACQFCLEFLRGERHDQIST